MHPSDFRFQYIIPLPSLSTNYPVKQLYGMWHSLAIVQRISLSLLKSKAVYIETVHIQNKAKTSSLLNAGEISLVCVLTQGRFDRICRASWSQVHSRYAWGGLRRQRPLLILFLLCITLLKGWINSTGKGSNPQATQVQLVSVNWFERKELIDKACLL